MVNGRRHRTSVRRSVSKSTAIGWGTELPLCGNSLWAQLVTTSLPFATSLGRFLSRNSESVTPGSMLLFYKSETHYTIQSSHITINLHSELNKNLETSWKQHSVNVPMLLDGRQGLLQGTVTRYSAAAVIPFYISWLQKPTRNPLKCKFIFWALPRPHLHKFAMHARCSEGPL